MVLLDDRRVEMQRGEDDQIPRPLFEYLIEIPDFEMTAHADQQRALLHPAAGSHPRRDAEPALAVHLRGRDEAQPPPEHRIARAPLPVSRNVAMMIVDARAIIDQQARIFGMETNEQIVPYAPGLDRDAELIGKNQIATCAYRRYRASNEDIVHPQLHHCQVTGPAKHICLISHRDFIGCLFVPALMAR